MKMTPISTKAHFGLAAICLILVLVHFPGMWVGDFPGAFATSQTDVVYIFEPYKLSTLAGWLNGEAFWWNDTASLGSPLAFPLGVGVLHPFHLFNLFTPAPLAYALGLCARLFVFFYFSYLYLRILGVMNWVAIMAALGLSFGNWNINYAQEIIGYTLCFFPMAIWAIERFAQQKSARYLVVLFFALTLMILGAFPSVLMYAWIVLGGYVLSRIRPFDALLLCSIPFLLASLLCSPLLLDTVNFYQSVQIDMSQRKALFNYIPPAHHALTFIFPIVHGSIAEHFPIFGQRDFFGTKLGAGILIAPALMLYVLTPNRRDLLKQPAFIFWAACLGFCFALYFNLVGIRTIVAHIPLLKDHPLTRLQAFIAISGAITSALILQHVFNTTSNAMQLSYRRILAPVLLAVFLWLALQVESTHYAQNFVILAVALCVALVLYWQGWQKTGVITSLLIVLASTIYSVSIYVDKYRGESFYPVTPLISEIQQQLKPGGRVLDVNNGLFNMRHAAYGVPSITGHYFTPPQLRKLIQTLGINDGQNGLSLSTITHFDAANAWPLLRRLHVQFVVLPNAQALVLEGNAASDYKVRLRDETSTLIEVRDNGQPSATKDGFSGAGYTGFKQSYGRVSFTARSAQAIELPIRMYSGWRVTTGGKLLTPSELGLIRVEPSGLVEVKLEYKPTFIWALRLLGPD